jgi:hypothetical protein
MLIQNAVQTSELAFPILECFHIAGFALAIGATALVDFRLLEWGVLSRTPAQLNRALELWMLGGLIVAVFAGFGLFSSDPDMYYENWAFLIKMFCLVLAILFNYTIHRKVVQSGASPGVSKLVACVSLALWVSIIFGGIFIAWVRPGLGLS